MKSASRKGNLKRLRKLMQYLKKVKSKIANVLYCHGFYFTEAKTILTQQNSKQLRIRFESSFKI